MRTFLFFIITLIASQAAGRTVHVFVALCDNANQGIVPVPSALGNGQDPKNNLYWGALYGVKTHFKNSAEWRMLATIEKPSAGILERVLFKHKTTDIYLLADAYDGREIKQCTINFLNATSGNGSLTINHDNEDILFGGCSDLLAYVGHDGLMEFSLGQDFAAQDGQEREAIILACASKPYFAPYLKATGAYPLLWTTHLMAPEAYTLEWALNAWARRKTREEIRLAGASAYHHYQKCGLNAARRLLVRGWTQ